MAARSVVIADSNVRLARVLAELLADEPGTVVLGVCHTAEQAVELVKAGHPDVVLVSETLDDLPGVDVCAALRRAAPRTALLLWSHDPSRPAHGRQVVDAVLERGMTFQELLRAVRADGRATPEPRVAPARRPPPVPVEGPDDGADDGALVVRCDSCEVTRPIPTADMPAAVAEARDFFVAHGGCATALDLTDPLARTSPTR